MVGNKAGYDIYTFMTECNIDVLLLTDGYNIHYLSGYKGHTGCMLSFGKSKYILTDSRYTEQVTIEAPDYICVDIGIDGYSKKVTSLLCNCMPKTSFDASNKLRIGFENKHISYEQFNAFNKAMEEEYDTAYEFVPLDEKVNDLRMIKSAEEIEYIAIAESIGDKAFSRILEVLTPGMTEKEIALELEYTMKKLGADGISFDTIAATGRNSSLPHAVPTEAVLTEGDFLTMDFGCIYKGYCSDMTRTVFIGNNPSPKQKMIYDLVLRAQTEAMAHIKPGVKCSDVDAIARDIISNEGYGDFFGHGLGHSVGLYIHESPRCSRKCDTILEPGMTMTVEPGIYLPGEFGVRIEDLVLVTDEGYKNLTRSPKQLICISSTV